MRYIFAASHSDEDSWRCSKIVELYLAFCLWIRIRRGLTQYVSSNRLSGHVEVRWVTVVIDYW